MGWRHWHSFSPGSAAAAAFACQARGLPGQACPAPHASRSSTLALWSVLWSCALGKAMSPKSLSLSLLQCPKIPILR